MSKISKIVLKAKVLSVERMTRGIANDVFSVTFPDKEVIFRANKNPSKIIGTEKYIPIFRSMGIKVPKIIYADYSLTHFPFAYQILTKVAGKDLGLVIKNLNEDELCNLAKEIARILVGTSIHEAIQGGHHAVLPVV